MKMQIPGNNRWNASDTGYTAGRVGKCEMRAVMVEKVKYQP
jgi:hypothetical protein